MIAQLRDTGKVSHAYLGVQAQAANDGSGAQIAQLTSDGPAADAGLQAGDVIISLGGQTVEDASTLTSLVDEHKPGDSVEVKIKRGGEEKTLTVKLGERPTTTQTAQQQQTAAADPRLRRRLVARRRGRSARGPAIVPAPGALTVSTLGRDVRAGVIVVAALLAGLVLGPPTARADWNGDGPADVLAIHPDGRLLMYRGNGAGGWITGHGEPIGGGWNTFSALLVPGRLQR